MRPLAALAALALTGCIELPKADSDSGTSPITATGDGDLVLSPGFGETGRTGEASATEEDTVCHAFFPLEPQLAMTLEANFLGLYLQVDSPDLAIRVNSDTGDFCGNIDAYPLPTVSRGAWSDGEYQIYIGSPTEDFTGAFELVVAEGEP